MCKVKKWVTSFSPMTPLRALDVSGDRARFFQMFRKGPGCFFLLLQKFAALLPQNDLPRTEMQSHLIVITRTAYTNGLSAADESSLAPVPGGAPVHLAEDTFSEVIGTLQLPRFRSLGKKGIPVFMGHFRASFFYERRRVDGPDGPHPTVRVWRHFRW